MKRWWVNSPSYEVVEPVLDDGSGPSYDATSFAEIEAPTARQAKVKAVRVWRQQKGDFDWNGDLTYCDDGYTNPFKGLTASEVKPCRLHGYEFENCVEGICIPYWCKICELPIEPLGSEKSNPRDSVYGDDTWVHELCLLTEEEHARAIYGFDYI